MGSKYLLLVFVLQSLVFVSNVTHCLSLDRSTSRKLLASLSDLNPENDHHKLNITKKTKLVEWDDDDLLNELHDNFKKYDNIGQYTNKRPTTTAVRPSLKQQQLTESNKLIYHGQLNRIDGGYKTIDGMRVLINTGQPVSINRRTVMYPSHDVVINRPSHAWKLSTDYKLENNEGQTLATNKGPVNNPGYDKIQEVFAGSDWRPIHSSYSNKQSTKHDDASKLEQKSSELKNIEPSVIKSSIFKTKNIQSAVPVAITLNQGIEKSKWKPVNEKRRDVEDPRKIKLPSISFIKDKKQSITTEIKVKDLGSRKYGSKNINPESVASIVYGKSVMNHGERFHGPSSIDEPFEDSSIDVITKNKLNPSVGEEVGNDSSALAVETHDDKAKKLELIKINKWTPLSNLNQSAQPEREPVSLTTTESSLSGNNSSELAHRSASDLNYIYSSTSSNTDWQAKQTPISSASSNYYSNYVQPAQQFVEQPTILTQNVDGQNSIAPIIDTTSGQVPEMIADRTPIQTADQQTSTDYYSVPQSMISTNNFQPALPLAVRAPQPAPTLSDNGYGNYYQPVAQPQTVRAPSPPQPAPSYNYNRQSTPYTTTVAPQVVRQEHHYHYYNNGNNQQQQQQPQQQSNTQFDRGQFSGYSSGPTTNTPVTNVIREIQPILISQQQFPASTTSTTTPAPQIIREIIKEVPAQTSAFEVQQIQIPRIIIPQMQQPTRQQISQIDPSYASPINSAQRVIRQISNSIPSVAVRMPPALSQIRIPAIQAFQALQPLSTRLQQTSGTSAQQPSVTRQTGSFIIPPMAKKTTTYLTETQMMPAHTTIMHTTQFTPATRTTVYTTDHSGTYR